MIIIDDIEQGSPQWDELRVANIGASSAHLIITTKGEPSKSADRFLEEMFDEAILHQKLPKFSSYRMKEGLLYESESFNHRNMILSATEGVQMRRVALCYKDERKAFHCSPDGLCEAIEQGFETKDAAPHIQRERLKKDPKYFIAQHFQQVQMSLYVTRYKSWILQSYCRNMPPLTLTVLPDLEFHKKLEARLSWFTGTLNNMIKEFKGEK
jgi:hypothetical protein